MLQLLENLRKALFTFRPVIIAVLLVSTLLLAIPFVRHPYKACTVVYRVNKTSSPSTLVVILAETRASELTWTQFQTHVIAPLHADLAVCASSNTRRNDPFLQAAKYVWLYPEPDDWADAFNEACDCNDCWRKLLELREQLFGGIKDTHGNEHKGSAAILIFYRWFLLKQLMTTRVMDIYDYFVITRSDYYYTAPHPRISEDTEPSNIWIPEGEDYGGLTDRHIVVPKMHLYSSLSLMEPIIQDPEGLFQSMRNYTEWNLETYIKFIFYRHNILQFVRRFPRVMFAVRSQNTSTRWSTGEYNPNVGMIVKYSAEYELAKEAKPLLVLP